MAVIKNEPGADQVRSVMDGAIVSSVTIAELATVLTREAIPPDGVASMISDLRLAVEAFAYTQALAAGLLYAKTKHRGLSLGDRACLALAMELGLPVMTGDRASRDLGIGVEIRFFR